METSRDRILERLMPTARASSHPGPATSSRFSESDLWPAFEGFLVALGGRLINHAELSEMMKEPCLVDPAAASLLGLVSEQLDVWDVRIGISVADFAIAETGTLVASAGAGKARMTTLAPPVNVMLVARNAIVATLAEAMPLLSSATSVMITGPSRTADIEGILVRGVHGPGELLVYVYE